MMRRCFYSFHYKPDNWRVAQVRNIGAIEGNIAATDNDWESISSKGDAAIKNWITNQMKGRSCTIVLIGADTANRKWINHEIIESWNGKMGVVDIHIHGLLDSDGKTAPKGKNPFDFITYGNDKKKLSSIVKCYTPSGDDSKERYEWIKENLSGVAEEALNIRNESQVCGQFFRKVGTATLGGNYGVLITQNACPCVAALLMLFGCKAALQAEGEMITSENFIKIIEKEII